MEMPPPVFIYILAGILGLCIGSFLNVVIYRWPLGLSIVKPRSACPQCKKAIAWYDNIPLLSFLILKGKCRTCHKAVSWRYFLVELLTAALSVATYAYYNDVARYLVYFLLFIAPLIAVIFIDLEHRLIPNAISITGIPVGVLVHYWDAPLAGGAFALKESLIGILVGGGFLFLVAWGYEKLRKREGLGGGDIKLAAMLGAFLGWQAILMILLVSSLLGSLIGICVVAFKRDWLFAIPFGPFLVLAGYLQLFFGEPILNWYLSHFH